MKRLAQSETWYPAQQESDSTVTAISVGICRISDGYWWDFIASAFQDVNDADSYLALAEGANGLWRNGTGWAIPNANSSYILQWKITNPSETFYLEGDEIIVNDALNGEIADSIHDEEVDNDGAAISLRGAIKLILSVFSGESSGGGTATGVFRDIAGTKSRISATVDSNGNRTAIGTRD